MRVAEERDLDLVEVAPNANPPVCRIMDYGKFMYDRQRREREARRTQKQTEVKEIRLRPKIAEHDIMVKSKQARGFLSEGNKVRVRVRFRGREITHRDIATDLLSRFAENLSDVSVVEQRPAMEGYTMLMVLAPNDKQ